MRKVAHTDVIAAQLHTVCSPFLRGIVRPMHSKTKTDKITNAPVRRIPCSRVDDQESNDRIWRTVHVRTNVIEKRFKNTNGYSDQHKHESPGNGIHHMSDCAGIALCTARKNNTQLLTISALPR